MSYGAGQWVLKLTVALLSLTSVAYAEPVTIAAFGDSLTQGYGLPPEDGFVAQLQSWLDDAGMDAQVQNAGVSGDTTAGGLSRVAWTLTPDVDAMILALGANDYLRGLDPDNARSNLAGILEAARSSDVEVLLVGLEVGGNYGPDYKEAFDTMYPELAASYGADYFPSWFAGLEGDDGAVAGRSDYFQADGIHPNAEGVALIVEAMGPAVLDLLARTD